MSDEEPPVLSADVVDEATQGSYCPKLCTFACPVHQATGRDDAVPWNFHRAVTDLADGRREPDAVRDDLVACTGCLACQRPCEFDQDVPAQVRDARAVAAPRTPAADEALAHLAAGARPDGTRGPATDLVHDGATALHAGCHDPAAVVTAARRLLEAAGHTVDVVADGCCGQLATDLGAPELARARGDHRRGQLAPAARVVSLDPHCLGALRVPAPVTDLWTALADDPPGFRDDPAGTVVYHDPCVLARGAGVTGPPRDLLGAAGFTLAEPEGHGADTGCSGAGMGLPLLDAAAAATTADHRAGQLRAAGDVVVTACARAADQLRGADVPVHDLAVTLAARLPEPG